MKTKLSLLASTVLLVMGCQSTKPETTLSTNNETPVVKTPAKPKNQQVTTLADIEHDMAEVNDVWQRIRNGMQLDIADKALINQYRQWYIDNPRHLEIISQRAEPFLYFILEEVEKRNLPTELALLPIIESSFNVTAYSHMHASGIWQLTLPTATTFKVKNNWWYDGRRDVRASTIAALDLLEYLYNKMDHNWIYAIAAYNSGEGRVFNAIKRNKLKGKPTNFWKLHLPKETAHYVPQLLALADAVKNASEYGINLNPIDNQPKIAIVDIGSQLDLKLAAEMANISVDELKALNPGLLRWATPPNGPHFLTIPFESKSAFNQKLAALSPDSRMNWLRYKIKPGDSLSVIARNYNTPISMIRSSNGIKGNNIIAGKYLIIPVAATDSEIANLASEQTLTKSTHKKSSQTANIYIVKSGDNLWDIARSNDVSVKQLTKWNKLNQKQLLKIGQKLVIYPNEFINYDSLSANVINYKVKSGDSLARIAARYNVSVNELVQWNSLNKNNYLQPGQMLKLLVSKT
ncbi:lytic transglycosylase [Shewanella gaetbuli]